MCTVAQSNLPREGNNECTGPREENNESAGSRDDATEDNHAEDNADGNGREADVIEIVVTDEECDTDNSNLCCSNCRRKQSPDLVNLYGEIYHIEFQRYVLY